MTKPRRSEDLTENPTKSNSPVALKDLLADIAFLEKRPECVVELVIKQRPDRFPPAISEFQIVIEVTDPTKRKISDIKKLFRMVAKKFYYGEIAEFPGSMNEHIWGDVSLSFEHQDNEDYFMGDLSKEEKFVARLGVVGIAGDLNFNLFDKLTRDSATCSLISLTTFSAEDLARYETPGFRGYEYNKHNKQIVAIFSDLRSDGRYEKIKLTKPELKLRLKELKRNLTRPFATQEALEQWPQSRDEIEK